MSPPVKKTLINMLLVLCALVLGGCDEMRDRRPPPEPPTMLNDIAWDVDERLGYTVYILEDGEYVPYLVLTNDFNGSENVLLLRQYLLDELRVYRYFYEWLQFDPSVVPSYYGDSDIDAFLNSEFYEKLCSATRDSIIDSSIEIIDLGSIGIGGQETISIDRKIFLLSFNEANGNLSRSSPIPRFALEGMVLAYFSSRLSRIAYHTNGEAGSWWLRSPNNANSNVVAAVLYEGSIGSVPIDAFGPVEEIGAVRPAFCLPRDTPIKEREIDGEMVFVLDLG